MPDPDWEFTVTFPCSRELIIPDGLVLTRGRLMGSPWTFESPAGDDEEPGA